ncbi:apolipoprotein N-acyltransferase [Lentzea flaviverrucosa]|uniref:Apolipoprotein N-acyltransferase n=1 Tax=Lentzea flaviverrucosa TaxID=200379 RepID=A0A1H9AB47_9PSEU|nr:apolipoprotein N-acyltransferase [Lentzea flaviverrucosa]RDI32113.1 apolipoprotein N-acyltransferase [Lentzea flaviverrucosa]SEP73900.1 apolipoprotein N-acyltransferase [Lentzea flaviverrucosa]
MRKPDLARYGAAAVAGGALALSFPPRTLWWLAVPAFVVFWLALKGAGARRSAGLGFAFGLAFFLPHLWWIQHFLGNDFGPWPWLVLSALMALFICGVCALFPLVNRLPAAPVWAALLFVLQETLRGLIPFNGFPWGRVAFGQVDGPFARLAVLGGAPLVTFAVVFTGFGLAAWFPRWTRAWALVPIVASLVVSPLISIEAQTGRRTVAVVQGNAPDLGLGLLTEGATLRDNHLRKTAELAALVRGGALPKPDLVVWPESATRTRDRDPVLDAAIADLGVPTLVSALRDGQNSVITWDPKTGAGESYAKQELVPFAEHIPLRPLARIFTPFADQPDLDAGTEPGVLDIAGTRVGVGICYEVAYDYVLRESAADGAQLLVVPTNNAWYGRGEMTYQQLGMARLRAIEHGRAVVVAAISGVSAVVRPDGSVVRSTGMFTDDLMVDTVPLRTDVTFATRFGAAIHVLLTGLALAACGVALWSRQRARRVPESRPRRTGEE